MLSSQNWTVSSGMLEKEKDEVWTSCPDPENGESFLSWFTRLAKENCSDIRLLYHQLKKQKSLRNIKMEVIETQLQMLEGDESLKDEIIQSLAPFLRIDLEKIKKLSQSVGEIKNKWDFLNIPLKAPRFCPYCLKEDETPYFRTCWFLKPYAICFKHKCVLLDSCPHCGKSIEFWKTLWNESIDCCHKCGQKISNALNCVLSLQGVDHLSFIKEVLELSTFNSIKIDPFLFFRQLWKVIFSETENLLIRNFHILESQIPVELLFREISRSVIKILNNPRKLEDPFQEKMSDNHLVQVALSDQDIEKNSLLLLKTNPIVKKRLRILAPLIALGSPSIKEIQEIGKEVEYNWRTVYNWWRDYQVKGISGLIPNHNKKGRKKKIPCYPEFNTHFKKKILIFVKGGENKTIKELLRDLQEEANQMGVPRNVISYSTLCRHVLDQKESLEKKS